MEKKLEVTKKLEDLGKEYLDSNITMLNLPSANFCEKRAEMVNTPEGTLEQACTGCITQGINKGDIIQIDEIKEVIDEFTNNRGTRIMTIPGRGDPFNRKLREDNLEKIKYTASKEISSYVFTAGNNLDEEVCKILAETGTSVMISLYGNKFIDADFFEGKQYEQPRKREQNQVIISDNIRRLIKTYKDSSNQPEKGVTRIGMNYVVSEIDLTVEGEERLRKLKEAANKNGFFFICNSDFQPHLNLETQQRLNKMAREYSDFNITHSTSVDGQCQMGAGSSATVDFNGELYRCPYMSGRGNGRFGLLSEKELHKVITEYMQNKEYSCVMRGTLK